MFVAIIIFIIITMKDGVRSLVSSLVSDYHIQNCKIKKYIYRKAKIESQLDWY